MNFVSHLCWLISPTRKFIDIWKVRGNECHRGSALRRWSLGLFLVELVACGALICVFPHQAEVEGSWFAYLLLYYAFSRICEIAYAFYRDGLSVEKTSDLEPSDRIRMAMRSYYGLAFNFALLYYFMPISGLFKAGDIGCLQSFFEAFYFSGVTLATLGYGDVVPVHMMSRSLALLEVFIGILILTVAVSGYIGRLNSKNDRTTSEK
jgi:voltage-gated potassium channel